MSKHRILIFFLIGLFLTPAIPAVSRELFLSRRAAISCNAHDALQTFNTCVTLGGRCVMTSGKKESALRDEVCHKVDTVVDKVETILGVYPEPFSFRIELCDSSRVVQAAYKKIYGANTCYIAFFSPEKNTVYISAPEATVQVIAHEFAHVIIHQFFEEQPPEKIHEMLAQYTELQVVEPSYGGCGCVASPPSPAL